MSKEPSHGDCRPNYDDTTPECATCLIAARCIEEAISQGKKVRLYSASDLHDTFIKRITTFLPHVKVTNYNTQGVLHQFYKNDQDKHAVVNLKTRLSDMHMLLVIGKEDVSLKPLGNMSEVHQTVKMVRDKLKL